MRILVTNDDGIHAPGLAALERIALAIAPEAYVYVVAPETDQSGVSHSLSLNDPLRLRRIDDRHFAVKGTPTDCVILGVHHVLKGEKPDLVLSGVNRGQNVAEDVTYSGTIAAAIEGTTLGIRSIAMSQSYAPGGDHNTPTPVRWDVAETHGPAVVRHILKAGIEPGIVVNVNFPNCAPDEVEGIAATVQGYRGPNLLRIDERKDGRGNAYFWVGFARPAFDVHEGTDLHALRHNRISVTPLKLDLTDLPSVTHFAQSFEGETLRASAPAK
ncbi:MAG: 5'/3'-nucleotidase SurE [Beijerinckiaceae bacterium]|nr:5'/3'-nucleotidase SurE [Beijerinckiaceae bacterium]